MTIDEGCDMNWLEDWKPFCLSQLLVHLIRPVQLTHPQWDRAGVSMKWFFFIADDLLTDGSDLP